MSMDHAGVTDAALLLDAIADVLEVMPALKEAWEQDERKDVRRACRAAAQTVIAADTSGQPYEASKAYAGTEWRNALLRSLVGADKAHDLLSQAAE